MMGYRYWDGPNDTRYCFNVEPTFVCENADPIETVLIDDDRFDSIKPSLKADYDVAASALRMDPMKLARTVRRMGHGSRERVDGKLTDRCKACGRRMQRLGFRVWIERPPTQEETTSELQISANVAERLGFSAPMKTVRSAYVDTKREAKQWCLDERATALAIAEEATA